MHNQTNMHGHTCMHAEFKQAYLTAHAAHVLSRCSFKTHMWAGAPSCGWWFLYLAQNTAERHKGDASQSYTSNETSKFLLFRSCRKVYNDYGGVRVFLLAFRAVGAPGSSSSGSERSGTAVIRLEFCMHVHRPGLENCVAHSCADFFLGG